MATVSNVRLNGCLFGPPSARDFRTSFKDRSVPDFVDLRPSCTTVEDQGQIGSCTANATVGALEYHYKRRDGASPDLSRMFVYFNARRMRGNVMADTGAFIREAMASVLAFGACREDRWPYDPMLFAAEPPPEAYADAMQHQVLQYARVEGGRGAIRALAEELPVVFGTVIPQRCFAEAASTGVIPAPTPEELNAPGQGGHAMLIVGYDNNRRLFIVRNSWGGDWGDHGYCWIPYDVMDACSRPEEFWVLAELEKHTGFELIRPRQAAKDEWDDEYETRRRAGAQLGGLAGSTAKMRDQIRSGLEADLAASSRKIDALLKGAGGPKGGPTPRTTAPVLPCTACAGSGVCPFCERRTPQCARCHGTGACPECSGTGVL
jgi:hypothetical protein